tara:strand:- start:593 stop:1258 length:666 start_codon:yes stop_codon:yes gene_type:complete
MLKKINLLSKYPETEGRQKIAEERIKLTEEEKEISRKFGYEYFDGPRKFGLGGYYYDPKFFSNVVEDFISYYGLSNSSKILDVGCGKGFMLHDFQQILPNCTLKGIDISQYCIENCIDSMKNHCVVGSCDNLPFEDNSFDLVISIATIHNLDLEGVKKSIKEINRVTKKDAFIKVNAHSNEEERKAFKEWNIVAKTSLYEHEWIELFKETNYNGEYYWFKP